jgi:hypothetical protein
MEGLVGMLLPAAVLVWASLDRPPGHDTITNLTMVASALPSQGRLRQCCLLELLELLLVS